MSAAGWIVMVLVLAGVWGGFIYLLLHTVRADREHHDPEH
jgi:hypothetical protein